MNFEETKIGGTLVITPEGHLDAQSEKSFEERVLESIEGGENKIVIDFSKIDYVSSAGLRALLIIAKSQKESDGALAICGLEGNVKEIFAVSGFDTIVDIYTDRDAAVEGLG
jgi:anti-anti-sigma factor